MKANIDISLFTATESIGVISGQMDFGVVPRVGEIVSFLFSSRGAQLPAAASDLALVKVAGVSHGADSAAVSLELEDVTATSRAAAEAFAAYLTDGFGLYFDPTNSDGGV